MMKTLTKLKKRNKKIHQQEDRQQLKDNQKLPNCQSSKDRLPLE